MSIEANNVDSYVLKLPIISLFSGALGLDLGLEQAGFQTRVAVECNKFAADTIRKNRPDIPVIEKKIEDVTTEEILETAGLKPGEPVIVSGGPSCQSFSTVGQRGWGFLHKPSKRGNSKNEIWHYYLQMLVSKTFIGKNSHYFPLPGINKALPSLATC